MQSQVFISSSEIFDMFSVCLIKNIQKLLRFSEEFIKIVDQKENIQTKIATQIIISKIFI